MKQIRKGLLITGVMITLMLFSCRSGIQTAGLVVTHARIWTGNPDQPFAEAMAIGEDTLMAVGSNEEILRMKGDTTREVNLEGHFVVPGFIDSHVHFFEGGFNLSSVQLRDVTSREEFIRKIADYAGTIKPGTWILGGDWDHTNWGGDLPERGWIDRVTPDHPVFINRLDGHMALANSLAMKLAGIGEDVRDVSGGTIVRDAAGKPTGIFKDNAMSLITVKIPPPTDEQADQALTAAMNFVASKGVTSVHHMSGYLDALERAREKHRMITRVYCMVPIENLSFLKGKTITQGKGDKWLKTGGVKGFVDGSLGSHTAAFLVPYTDSPADSGFFVNTGDDLYNWTLKADSEGFQVVIHAIGDRAVRYLLDMYDSVAAVNGPRDRRFRIEHAQHLAPGDVARFAKSGIIASMQPYHCIDDGRWAEKLVGPERIKDMYVFKSLFDSGATVAFGSDWYVAPPTPLEGIYGAVTRRTLDDKNPGGWIPEQKITVEQALKAYTLNGAYASFEENIKGSLEPGKLADFVVISEDLLRIDPARIRDAHILQTWVGGEKVFEKE